MSASKFNYTPETLQQAVANAAGGAKAFQTVTAGITNTFASSASPVLATHGSMIVRNEYTRDNYDAARPSERVPQEFIEVMTFCNEAYFNISIVRNIIDLMSDFCVKGIDWNHKNKNVQSFYRSWFNKIDGRSISERFCNYLLRLGNACIVPEYSKIPRSIADNWSKTLGYEFKDIKVNSLEIPSSYTFIDITALVEELSVETTPNTRRFKLNGNGGLISSFSNYSISYRFQNSTPFSGKTYQSLPVSIRNKISETGVPVLEEGKDILIYHYRKDDWDTWARPITMAVAEPLIMLKKMHLADASALDGVISNVRLWRVGYIDQTNVLNSIIPSPEHLETVSNMIKQNVAGGVLDIVWGPDIDFKESSSSAHHFLFADKYAQIMSEIYDGYGVNPSLAGGVGGKESGMTNNAISMKVLVERLSYIRNKLMSFWSEQARVIQKAMGFTSPAVLSFDDAIFSDEISYKKLILELYDRDIISIEGLREEFNLINPIEASRVVKEAKRRKKGTIEPKASPYHDPMVAMKLKSDLIKGGNLDGHEMNVDVKKEDVFSKDKGGRPIGAKDNIKRDTKSVSPKKAFGAAEFLEMKTWAYESFHKIADIISDNYLSSLGKKNRRQLTEQESNEFEDVVLCLLCSLDPFTEVTDKAIAAAVNNVKDISLEITIRQSLLSELSKKMKRSPTMEDRRIAASASYAMSKTTEN